MDSKQLDDIVLAVLFASDEALNIKRIEAVLDDVSTQELSDSLKRLQVSFGTDDSVIRLEQVAGGYQLSTSPRFSEYVARLYRGRRKQRLSKAAMETLAIIAYKQPVTRADIENIRGVACGGVVTTLMERSLIRIVGKARVLGSPFLYGTTQEFLEYLGLNNLKELPSLEELEALLNEEADSETIDENGDRSPAVEAGVDDNCDEAEEFDGEEAIVDVELEDEPEETFEETFEEKSEDKSGEQSEDKSGEKSQQKYNDGLDDEGTFSVIDHGEPVTQAVNEEESDLEPEQTRETETSDEILADKKENGRE